MADQLMLVPYDRRYLDLSWDWLADPETRALTMTPEFTREDQSRFFEALPERSDYRLWGIELVGDGPIGAAGLKRIRPGIAEYFGYIGEKRLWGRGLGALLLAAVEGEAIGLGLDALDLTVARDNARAIRLYEKHGYRVTETHDDCLIMIKELAR